MLRLTDVNLEFGGIKALTSVSFDVPAGQICGLIGPNGAGKTSLFNCITRVYQPSSGQIELAGKDLLGLAPHRIAAAGVGRTYQNLALFPTLSLLENTVVGARSRRPSTYLSSLLGLWGSRRIHKRLEDEAIELLDWLDLADLADHKAEGLPFGTLKRVELARALASRPEVVLLDEPAGGLTHEEVEELGELILQVRDKFDVAVLMVEHHLGLVGQVCDHLIAMNFGRVISEGMPDAVRTDPQVVAAYLGGSE